MEDECIVELMDYVPFYCCDDTPGTLLCLCCKMFINIVIVRYFV